LKFLPLKSLCLLSQRDELNPIDCSLELIRHIAVYYEPKPIGTSKIISGVMAKKMGIKLILV